LSVDADDLQGSVARSQLLVSRLTGHVKPGILGRATSRRVLPSKSPVGPASANTDPQFQ